MPATKKKAADNWFRSLKNDRLEISLAGKTSGPKEPIWQVVAMFEEMTGQQVVGDWKRPPRTGARPLVGQLSITEQLESDHGDEE